MLLGMEEYPPSIRRQNVVNPGGRTKANLNQTRWLPYVQMTNNLMFYAWIIMLVIGILALVVKGISMMFTVKKKAKSRLTIFAVIGVIMLVIGGLGSMGILQVGSLQTQSVSTPTQAPSVSTGLTTTSELKCVERAPSINVKLYDDYADSSTLISSATAYAMNVESGVIENSTATSSGWVTLSVTCGETYKIYVTTVAGTSGSAESEEIFVDDVDEYVKLHTNKISKMTVKVKDIDGDDWEYLFADAGTSGTNSTTGVDMNATNIYDAVGASDFSVSTDGYLDMELYVKSATNRYHHSDLGEIAETNQKIGLKNYVCVDLGGATNGQEWDTDSLKVTVDGGSALPDVKSEIDEDSREYVYVQKSEACYEIGDVDDTFSTIGFYVKAKSSNDPDATDDDITLYFLPEGTYQSSEDGDVIKRGLYSDASTQVGVVYSADEVPYVVFNIA